MTVYSNDLRERAVKYIPDGHFYRETSKASNVGSCALCRWKKMLDEQGNLQDKPRKKYFRKIYPKKLEDFLRERPDVYLREAAEIFGCSKAPYRKR